MTTTIAPSTGAGLLFSQQGVGTTPGYSALDLRRSEIVGPVQEGVYAAGDYMVTQRGAGANMSVDIAAGSGAFAAVQGDSVTGQGLYIVGPHSAAAINETIAAADPTNPRVDIVILEIQDNVHDASGGNLARTRVLTGTPTGGANLTNRTNAPALPANALLLADVLVGAGVTSVPNTVIRDRRKWARGAYSVIVRNANAIAGNDYTTTSGAAVEIDAVNVSRRIEFSGLPVRVCLRGQVTHSVTGGAVDIQIRMDGSQLDGGALWRSLITSATSGLGFEFVWEFTPAAGSHLVQPYWFLETAGTATLYARTTIPAGFSIRELIRQNTSNGVTTSG